jgi:hypothetical protein
MVTGYVSGFSAHILVKEKNPVTLRKKIVEVLRIVFDKQEIYEGYSEIVVYPLWSEQAEYAIWLAQQVAEWEKQEESKEKVIV